MNVLVPIRRDPEGFKETDVLSIKIPGPPGANVAPATENPVGFAEKVEPPTVKRDDGRGSVESVVVMSPTVKTPDGSRWTVLPATTAADPPGVMVVPDATRKAPSTVNR